jgi:anti-sigma B factor antagonist
MEIQEQIVDQVIVLSLKGELMGGNDADTFKTVVDRAIRNEHVDVVVDLQQVRWMNSSGLGILISALTSLRSSGGDLRLANLNDRLRRPLQITKLDTVFQEYETIDQAVNSYQQGRE